MYVCIYVHTYVCIYLYMYAHANCELGHRECEPTLRGLSLYQYLVIVLKKTVDMDYPFTYSSCEA